MIVDLRQLPHGARLEADLCIVGAGPAGITVARRFAAGSRSVLLIESGGLEVEPEPQELNRGEVRGESYYDLRLPRSRVFGGTSAHWTGEMGELDERVFAPRSWVAGSGWPIPFAEIRDRYPEALAICGGSPWPATLPPNAFERRPEPPGGANWIVPRYRQRRNGRARHFGVEFRDQLAASRAVRVLLHATVTELVADGEGAHVTAAELRSLDGRRATVRARAFVLAGGGIENARLLLLSNRGVPSGLGNGRDRVGRCFQEHPVVELGSMFGFMSRMGDLGGLWAGHPVLLRDFVPTPEFAARERILHFGIEFAPRAERSWNTERRYEGLRSVPGEIARFLPWLTDHLEEQGEAPRMRRGVFQVMQEMEPDPANRVTLGEERDALGCRLPVLDLRFGDSHRRTLIAVARAVVRELGRFSMGRVELPKSYVELARGEVEDWHGAAHHMGTTRMADDPAQGVVDRDCRVHGVDNLWLAGSSVFPVSGYVNPTVTIVALALRLADHLAERLS